MVTRRAILALLAIAAWAGVPTPKEHFGFTPGDDYKLANSEEVLGYFRKLAAASDRIRLVEYGKSSEGRPLVVAFISSAGNLKKLDHYKALNRRLALGQATPEEAGALMAEARAIVWIDSGMHATEVAPVQHAPHLAYRMITGEDEETRRIRDNVILVQAPVLNPDGLDMTVGWYRKNVGSAYETAPLPWLYQKYAGHDNNRDWFMLNLEETRAISRMLFEEWFPQIVYNQHQVAPFPARIFIPPYAEPLNPNIPVEVMEGINGIGAAMKKRLAREGKTGAVSYMSFDAWWNGGLRTAPAFHNMHGILTETAGYQYATPKEYKLSELPERFATGIPTKEPSVFYEKPWLGGRWALMDAVEYMLTADFAILEEAAARRAYYVDAAWRMARANIESGLKGGPFAYVVPEEQHDAWSAQEMLRRLEGAGLEVKRARAAFTAGGKTYPAGTWVLPAAQPFRGYLVDLMEPQKYPEIRSSAAGPVKRPYDLAGWTLRMQMGVEVARVDAPFEMSAESGKVTARAVKLDARETGASIAIADELKAGRAVYRDKGGALTTSKPSEGWALKQPRVGLYQSWAANMDAGWTEWVLDNFGLPHTALRNEDVRKGALRARFDVIILAQQPMASILHGVRTGRDGSKQRPEYMGGIGVEGAGELKKFVEEGGTLVAFDTAAELPLTLFGLGVRAAAAEGWTCPGSLLKITLDPAHPVAFGMPKEAVATSTGGQAFDVIEGEGAKAFAWYAQKDLLASGWIAGERAMAGKPAAVEARLGAGRVVLFGFRPQFRGQSFGTLKMVLNAVWQSSARPL